MMKQLSTIILLLITYSVFSQKLLKKADKAFDELEYYNAIKHYSVYLADNENDVARANLAECYLNTNQYRMAEEQYSQLGDIFNTSPVLQLNYSRVLQLNGKIDEAKNQIELYLKNNSGDTDGQLLLKSCNMMNEFRKSENKYTVIKKDFSNGNSNFSPVYYQDNIMYTTDQGGKLDKWTGRSYSNIYIYNPMTGKSNAVEGNLNGKYHNGVVSFIDENTMIFTRNSEKKNKDNDYNLLLAEAKLIDSKWEFSQFFPYNNESEYNVAYPSVDASGKTLIFASDKQGGKGGWDLYKCTREGNSWSTPVNLSNINTRGNEMFPNISGSQLTFSSDGYPGMGGLDLFITNINLNDTPQNMGMPFNSHRDDFGLITNDDMKSGYFCSNRGDDTGLDHIYRFDKNPEIVLLTGIVLDEYTSIPLKETTVTLTNTINGESTIYETKEDGRFNFNVTSDQAYHLTGIKNEISTSDHNIDLRISTEENKKLYFKLLHNDPRFSLEGYTQSAKNENGIADVNVSRYNSTNNENLKAISQDNGYFKFQLEQNADFEISGEKNGHYTSVSTATTKGLSRSTTLYVKLFLAMEEVIIGETKIIGKEKIGGWPFDPIYYDLDKDNIRKDASIVLDQLVDFLNQNKNLSIELGAHTDSRGKDQYNQDLSSRRAASAVRYLISKGISEDRLQSKGYGENTLINECSNGVSCTEEQHQLNRRTEIKVLAINNSN